MAAVKKPQIFLDPCAQFDEKLTDFGVVCLSVADEQGRKGLIVRTQVQWMVRWSYPVKTHARLERRRPQFHPDRPV